MELFDAAEFNVVETPTITCIHGMFDIRGMLHNILYVLCLVAIPITLFRSITMFCGSGNIWQNIPPFMLNMGNIPTILSVPHNIVMAFMLPYCFHRWGQCLESFWAHTVGQDPNDSKSNRLHVHIFRLGFHSSKVHSIYYYQMIGISPNSNFNRLFLKLNRFICNQPPVLPEPWSRSLLLSREYQIDCHKAHNMQAKRALS